VLGKIFDLWDTAEAKCHIAGIPLVVPEIVTDDLTLVSKAENEVLMPLGSKALHDVPKNRPATNGHHGFRAELGLLTETSSQTTAKNDDFFRVHGVLVSALPRCEIGSASLTI
jgi:hypothetical protein